MTSVYLPIANAIVTQVQAVSNAGNAYNRQRYTSKWNDYLNQFAALIFGQKLIRGWTLTLQSINNGGEETADIVGGLGYLYLYKLIGINALKDITTNTTGSENDFLIIAENVMDQINSNRSFNLDSQGIIPFSPVCWITKIDIRQFGDILCNVVEFDINVSVTKTLSYIN